MSLVNGYAKGVDVARTRQSVCLSILLMNLQLQVPGPAAWVIADLKVWSGMLENITHGKARKKQTSD